MLKKVQVLIQSAAVSSSMHGQDVMSRNVVYSSIIPTHATKFHHCEHDVLQQNSSELNNMMFLQVNILKITAGETGLKVQLVLPNVQNVKEKAH